MKRTGFKWKPRKLLKRVKLASRHASTTNDIKDEIQAKLRDIVILRDKRCILYGKRCWHKVGDEGIVWQAEHLIERSNSATYADTRLVVLVCKNCHGWKHFKKSNHDQYDEWVKESLSPETIAHWDRCKKLKWTTSKMDWRLELLGLNQEYEKMLK